MSQRRVDIAWNVRRRILAFASRQDWLDCSTLECGCAVASFALAEAFKMAGIDAEMVVGTYDGYDHCWVESGNNIYDLTLRQFVRSAEPVAIRVPRPPYSARLRGEAAVSSTATWAGGVQAPHAYMAELMAIASAAMESVAA